MESFIIVAFHILAYSQMFYSDGKKNISTSFDLYKLLYFQDFWSVQGLELILYTEFSADRVYWNACMTK